MSMYYELISICTNSFNTKTQINMVAENTRQPQTYLNVYFNVQCERQQLYGDYKFSEFTLTVSQGESFLNMVGRQSEISVTLSAYICLTYQPNATSSSCHNCHSQGSGQTRNR